MNVAGRTEEIAIMQSLLSEKHSSFLAVYGRRRVGKTFLVREIFSKYTIFECSGLHERDLDQQLENFWLTLLEIKKMPHSRRPNSWLQAFSLLKNYIQQLKGSKKKVIFLDEIAWFETPKSGFLAALDNFWNQFCSKRKDIILVICGSAASWIIEKVINNCGGLHNRVTHHIQLMPFTLKETQEYLTKLNVRLTPKDIVSLYMCLGGIPYYLKNIKPGQSVAQILNNLLFKAQAPLRNEFSNLYASLFKNSHLHEEIVSALAKKNKGLTRGEIMAATGIKSGGGFSLLLQELSSCGFVKIIQPINKTKEDALYRLVDEFTIFYFKFLHKKKGNTNWLQQANSQTYKIWAGYAFENCCLKHILPIKKALGISGIISNEYSWIQTGNKKQKGTQIDFIIDRADNCINLLELKYHDRILEISKNYAEELNEKAGLFAEKTRTRKNIFTTLISANGTKKNEHYLHAIHQEVFLADLFVS